jgi:Tfp pilus assembly protein PilN
VQHLNLYKQLEKPKEVAFSARQLLRLVGISFVFMMCVYGWLAIDQQSINKELAKQVETQRVIDEQLSGLNTEKNRRLKDNQLEQDIAQLKRDVSFRRQLLASVNPEDNSTESGFAKYLKGLSRQHISGMWFTDIELHQGGQQLALLGETRSPETVPRFIQGLSKEAIFSGHQFRIFRLYSPENENSTLNFELRSREQGFELTESNKLSVNNQ